MPPFLSLRHRAILLSLLVVGLPAATCMGILVEVAGIRSDADRLREETRESGLANRLLEHIQSLRSALSSESDGMVPASLRAFAAEVNANASWLLERIEAVPADTDPSRAEHQQAEDALMATVAGGLAAVSDWLVSGEERLPPEVLARLDRARVHASVLAEETYEESELAYLDLERRARASRILLLLALGTVILASCTGLWLVFRTVLAPIQALRRGAERLRGGDLAHRIEVRGKDEIAELGLAFNALADEVHRSHEELREKVDTRTRELLHAARLADVGVLAAGLAHEVNTPLASIASCAEGLLRRLEAGTLAPEREREYLRTIVSEAYRTRDIVRRLLDLARPTADARATIQVRELFGEVERLTAHLLEEKALRLRLDLPAGLPEIRGNPGELLQVLMNLVLNARDASPRGGEIVLRARGAGGGQVWEVEDRGPGIPSEALERVFDPFFTTKDPGAGTGLGLSLAAAIVDRHGGTIRAENLEGGGARLRLSLPSGERAA